MRFAIAVMLFVLAAACGGPQIEVEVFTAAGAPLEAKLVGDGTVAMYSTVAGDVRVHARIDGDPLAVAFAWRTAPLDRAAIIRERSAGGPALLRRVADESIVDGATGIGEATLNLSAEHPCCSGTVWRVEIDARSGGILDQGPRFVVWANDAPGEDIEGE